MRIEEAIQQRKFNDEFQKLVVNILYTSSWLNHIQLNHFRPHNMTGPQYNILRILRGQHPNPATIRLLTERMIDKTSNASRIVDRLERKGLVSRTINSEDRRAVDVVISRKGIEFLEDIEHIETNLKDAMSNLSKDEARQLNDLLDKLRE